jgi:O6-methylguanine-DNA--protein-cysteine methyltransferase
VIPGKAGIGGYVGGEAKKRWLLRLERNYQPPAA